MSLFGPRPIGLALGSGAARGIAHVGVLKALEAEGLRPDVITGASMGAVVGAFYAAGYTVVELERFAADFDTRALVTLGEVALRRGAILSGERVEEFLRQHLPATFEELRIPFGCVATDLVRNQVVEFTSGDLITALRASMSIPAVFLPVRLDGMLLVDGAVREPVPVALARALGARVIVAVEVCGSGTVNLTEVAERDRGFARDLRQAMRGERTRPRGSTGLDVIIATYEVFEKAAAELSIKSADVVLSPDVHHCAGFEYNKMSEMIVAGEAAAHGAASEVRRRARR